MCKRGIFAPECPEMELQLQVIKGVVGLRKHDQACFGSWKRETVDQQPATTLKKSLCLALRPPSD